MDRNRNFRTVMEETGSNIRVIKQTFEDGFIQERVLVIFGRRNEVEAAIEKIAILLQDETHLRNYSYMKYPDLTLAYAAGNSQLDSPKSLLTKHSDDQKNEQSPLSNSQIDNNSTIKEKKYHKFDKYKQHTQKKSKSFNN